VKESPHVYSCKKTVHPENAALRIASKHVYLLGKTMVKQNLGNLVDVL